MPEKVELKILTNKIISISHGIKIKEMISEILDNDNIEDKKTEIMKVIEENEKNVAIPTYLSALLNAFSSEANIVEIDTRPDLEGNVIELIQRVNRIIPKGFFAIKENKIITQHGCIDKKTGNEYIRRCLLILLERKHKYWYYPEKDG